MRGTTNQMQGETKSARKGNCRIRDGWRHLPDRGKESRWVVERLINRNRRRNWEVGSGLSL